MSEITVDVDDQVLTAAAQALRTSTEKDTVNAALRAAVEHGGISHSAPPTADADEAFDHAWNRLAEIAESGVWDWMSDKRAYRGGYPLPDRLERPLADDAQ
ncbi:type II toxin-antitoxin system VapB family antitoxin [Sphaerisporangium rhizosphaerae]|uniref:Type II toxin-antitoxin system VapB family antitoxin n=1 Tax=Sphaerisporangium rhizosphaerae TaxID=2269375 RepID=A0ABW2PCR4_9ACTN